MAVTTNIAAFLKQFKAHQQLCLEASSKAINYSLLQTYMNIVQRTPAGNPNLWHPPYWPAGYQPGDLKKSWHIAYNGQERTVGGQFSNAEQTLESGGLSFKVGTLTNQVATIYNSQPYAQRIEEGWSTQAPQGMMRISVAEWTSNLDRAVAKYRIK